MSKSKRMPSRKSITAPRPADTTERVPGVDLAALLDRHLGPVAEPRRPGEFTVNEIASIRRVSGKRANAILTLLLSQGVVTRRPGRKNQYLYRFVK